VESQNKRPRSLSSISSASSIDGMMSGMDVDSSSGGARSPQMTAVLESAGDSAIGAGQPSASGSSAARKFGDESREASEGGGAPTAPAFQIKGTQGQLNVCEHRSIKNGGSAQPYMLVRLRGQSNTLPNDAMLSVALPGARPKPTIDVHLARVRLKAGELRYDYMPKPTTLKRVGSGAGAMTTYQAPLLSSIFSKKCWQGMVVRGPRMFVAFIKDSVGGTGGGEHSVPMFVEISPTSNSPEYRDPVVEYSRKVIRLFFAAETVTSVFTGAK
jgi:hypothetical protein